MKKFALLLSACALLTANNSFAQDKGRNMPAAGSAPQGQQKPASAAGPLVGGLFDVQRQGNDWFFHVPDSLLGRPILCTTRYIATPVGINIHGGELANEQVVYWEKKENKLLLRAYMFDAVAPEGSSIAQAVRNSNESPLLATLDIEKSGMYAPQSSEAKDSLKQKSENRKFHRVKVTALFATENPLFTLSKDSKNKVAATALRPDLSLIDSVRTYPLNTEVSTLRTYMPMPTNHTPSAQKTGVLTFRLNTSFVLLPKDPMRPRYIDTRVGYFTESFVNFNDEQQQVRRRHVATRWRLEPREEDIEKMKRGELVEPKKPIVFYIDPATPKQWREYLKQGVNDWQVAFEQAGFKNAIYALDWPEDDPTMSLEDARFSVIRYLASSTPNAYGPHVHDPRSGEIIESHIGWYHNVMQLLHDWYMTQVGAIDARAQKMQFDEELMGQLIRFVSSHEVGHTLGLRHNMGSSSRTPVEKLRDKAWVEKHGHTASIMDYARFNYVAQPEDNIDVAGIYPRINDYDKWAIEWGYKYFPDAKNAEEERLLLNQITVDRLSKNDRLWFGGEGQDNDPNAQTEDLGDDAMIASSYGLKNLRIMVKNLEKWTYEEGDLGQNLSQMYKNAVSQYRRYIGHVCRNIGGIHREYKSVEQSGPMFTPMKKERQKRALAWLKENVFERPSWMIAPSYVQRLEYSPETLITPLAETAVSYIFSAYTIGNVSRYSYGKDPYLPTEYVNDLLNVLFPPADKGTTWSRFIQQKAVQQLIRDWKSTSDADARPYLNSLLQKIQQRLVALGGNEASVMHYNDLRQQIKLALEGKK